MGGLSFIPSPLRGGKDNRFIEWGLTLPISGKAQEFETKGVKKGEARFLTGTKYFAAIYKKAHERVPRRTVNFEIF